MGSSKPSGPSAEELEIQRLQKEQLEEERANAERKKKEAEALRKARAGMGIASQTAADAGEGGYGSSSLLGI